MESKNSTFREKIINIPLRLITKPTNNHKRVICNSYWVFEAATRTVLFYRAGDYLAPQTNTNKDITDYLIKCMYPDCESKFIKVAFVPNNTKNLLEWMDKENPEVAKLYRGALEKAEKELLGEQAES